MKNEDFILHEWYEELSSIQPKGNYGAHYWARKRSGGLSNVFQRKGKTKAQSMWTNYASPKTCFSTKGEIVWMHLCNGDNGSNSCTGTFLMCGCKNGRTRRSPPPREHMFPLERWTLSKIVPGWATSWLLWTQPGRQHENVSHWQTKKSQPYFWKNKLSQKNVPTGFTKNIYTAENKIRDVSRLDQCGLLSTQTGGRHRFVFSCIPILLPFPHPFLDAHCASISSTSW